MTVSRNRQPGPYEQCAQCGSWAYTHNTGHLARFCKVFKQEALSVITSSSPFPPSLKQIADKIAPDMEPHRWVTSTYRATVERKGRTYRVTTDRTNINNDALVTVHRSAAVAARTVHNWLEHRVRKVIK